MNMKTSATIIALLMASVAFVGIVNALPTGGENWIGPRPQDDCATPQALGHSGGAAGTSNGYHSYTQGTGIGALDACFNAADIPPFAGCAVGEQQTADSNGVATITSSLPPNPNPVPGIIQGVGQILDPSLGGGNLYQTACGGLGGSGTDGEYEWGTNEAILNVRVGPATAGPEAGFGDGAASCLGSRATAHHQADTAIFVQDAALGSYIGFSVLADWARPAGLSATGVDDNQDLGLSSHCGDGAVEPCTTTSQAGLQNDITTYGGAGTAVADLVANTQVPTSTRALNHDLDVVEGCNPLDVRVNVAPSLLAPGPLGGPNVLFGASLDSATYGYGGASGQLTVLVNRGPQGVCADVAGGCNTPGLNVNGQPTGRASIAGLGAAPTLGWIWTGSYVEDYSDVQTCTVIGPNAAHVCVGAWDYTSESVDDWDCTGAFAGAGAPTTDGDEFRPSSGDVSVCQTVRS